MNLNISVNLLTYNSMQGGCTVDVSWIYQNLLSNFQSIWKISYFFKFCEFLWYDDSLSISYLSPAYTYPSWILLTTHYYHECPSILLNISTIIYTFNGTILDIVTPIDRSMCPQTKEIKKEIFGIIYAQLETRKNACKKILY